MIEIFAIICGIVITCLLSVIYFEKRIGDEKKWNNVGVGRMFVDCITGMITVGVFFVIGKICGVDFDERYDEVRDWGDMR